MHVNRECRPGLCPGAGRMLVLALWFCLALLPSAVWSASPQVVVVGGTGAYHHAVFTAMRGVVEQARSSRQVVFRTVEQYLADKTQQPVLLVAVGTAAAEALVSLPRRAPLLCVLIPRGEYAALPQQDGAALGALFVDQPLRRYLLLARLTLPERRNVGAVLGPLSGVLAEELRSEGRRLQLDVHTATIESDQELAAAVEQASVPAGVLLALPDPLVVNVDTARTLILSAYHRGVALVGYSQALAKAGALMAVHSTPEQLGQEAGEMVLAALASAPLRLPPPRHPSYFSVSVNYQVARALGLNLPAEESLVRELQRQEGAR